MAERLTTLHEIKRETLDRIEETTELFYADSVELCNATNPSLCDYSPAELDRLSKKGLIITYSRIPVAWKSYDSSNNRFYFSFYGTSRNNNTAYYFTECYVTSGKTIVLSSEITLPKTVNSKSAGSSNGNITLVAGDIQGASGWSPSADNDLATKKYVDDNAGGSGKEDVSNKVTAIDNTSTDTQYPSAKCVYDELTAKQNTLTAGTGISIVGDTISATGGGSLPSGTATGEILVWDNTVQAWAVKPKWQMYYQPVEYIESTGTQRIDTGVKTTNGVIIDFQYTSVSNDSCCFGAMTSNTSNRYDIIYYDGLYFSCGDGADVSTEITGDATRRILLEQGVTSQDLKIDGTVIGTYPAFTNTCTYNTQLFARRQGTSYYFYSSAKIYSCKLYVDGTLQRDFVPCYRIADGVIGMYDIVNGVFYTNNGTGTFTKGADV